MGTGAADVSKDKTEDLIADRGSTYGPPLENHECIAARWTATMRRAGLLEPTQAVSWREVVLCMIDVKQSRQAYRPKQDNLDDIRGYVRVYELAEEAEKARHPVDVVAETTPTPGADLSQASCDGCGAPADELSLTYLGDDDNQVFCKRCYANWEKTA